MIDHAAVIKQQVLDQNIVEESEYSDLYGLSQECDPQEAPEFFADFIERRYDYDDIPIGGRRRIGLKATKLG